jgi:hypothetical protein
MSEKGLDMVSNEKSQIEIYDLGRFFLSSLYTISFSIVLRNSQCFISNAFAIAFTVFKDGDFLLYKRFWMYRLLKSHFSVSNSCVQPLSSFNLSNPIPIYTPILVSSKGILLFRPLHNDCQNTDTLYSAHLLCLVKNFLEFQLPPPLVPRPQSLQSCFYTFLRDATGSGLVLLIYEVKFRGTL